MLKYKTLIEITVHVKCDGEIHKWIELLLLVNEYFCELALWCLDIWELVRGIVKELVNMFREQIQYFKFVLWITVLVQIGLVAWVDRHSAKPDIRIFLPAGGYITDALWVLPQRIVSRSTPEVGKRSCWRHITVVKKRTYFLCWVELSSPCLTHAVSLGQATSVALLKVEVPYCVPVFT